MQIECIPLSKFKGGFHAEKNILQFKSFTIIQNDVQAVRLVIVAIAFYPQSVGIDIIGLSQIDSAVSLGVLNRILSSNIEVDIIASPARQVISVGSAVQNIIAAVTHQGIVAGAAEKLIVALKLDGHPLGISLQIIIAITSQQDIRAAFSPYSVISAFGIDIVITVIISCIALPQVISFNNIVGIAANNEVISAATPRELLH